MARATAVAAVVAAGAILLHVWERLDAAHWWVVVAVIAIAASLPWTLGEIESRTPPGFVPLALAGVAAIEYACVPETDQFLGAAVPAVIAGAVEVAARRRVRLAETACALLILWAGIYGATGRTSAYAGALFAWWPIVAPAMLAGRGRQPVIAFVAIAGIAAAVVARTGGVSTEAADAGLAVALAAPASLLAMAAAEAFTRRVGRPVTTP